MDKKIKLDEAWEYSNSHDLRELLNSVFGIDDGELLDHFIKWFSQDDLKNCLLSIIKYNDLEDDFYDNDLQDDIDYSSLEDEVTSADILDYLLSFQRGTVEPIGIVVNQIFHYFPEEKLIRSLKDFLKDNDLQDEFEFFNYNELDEALPFDLAKAYKNRDGNRDYTRFNTNIDFENSDYTEVTPEEAKQIYKTDPESLHLVIDGQLITFRENGKPSLDYRIHWLNRDKFYTRASGEVIRDTKKMPASHLFSIASKIYKVDEKTKDQDLLNNRKQNPESPKYNYNPDKVDLTGPGYWDNPDYDKHVLRGSSYPSDYTFSSNQRDIDYYKDRIAQEKSDFEQGHWNGREEDYQRTMDRLTNMLNSLENRRKELLQQKQDFTARKRFANSEKELKEPFNKYRVLKKDLKDISIKVGIAKDKLQTTKDYGSPETREVKSNLEELFSKLENLQKEIRKAELYLKGCDEEDAEAVEAAEKEVNSVVEKQNELQAEMNKLLRRDQ
jgi:hypothetical protein